MKKKLKILVTVLTTAIVVGLALAINTDISASDVLGQLNNSKNLTTKDYHVEKTIILLLIYAIINAVVWTRKEQQTVIRKKIFFDFLNYERKDYEK